MSNYTTLVFRCDTARQGEEVRKMSTLENCTAWSRDDEILRMELIEGALDDGDVDLAKSYIVATNLRDLAPNT